MNKPILINTDHTKWVESTAIYNMESLIYNKNKIGETKCGRTIMSGSDTSGNRKIAVSGEPPDGKSWCYWGLLYQ